MARLWFKLDGKDHDEASLRVEDLHKTVDEVKDLLLKSEILDIPRNAKKSTLLMYMQGKDGIEKAKLSARSKLKEIDYKEKTIHVLTHSSLGLDHSNGKNTKDSSQPLKNDKSHKRPKKRSLSDYKALEAAYSPVLRKRSKKSSSSVGPSKPCAHNCSDKQTCSHDCCKFGIDSDIDPSDVYPDEDLSLYSDDYDAAPSPSKKRRLKPKHQTNTPCSHRCADKRTCGHKCCKIGAENTVPRKKKEKVPKRGPCKHQCLDKFNCGHACCKVGLEGYEGYDEEGVIEEEEEEGEEEYVVDNEKNEQKEEKEKDVSKKFVTNGVRMKAGSSQDSQEESEEDGEGEGEEEGLFLKDKTAPGVNESPSRHIPVA